MARQRSILSFILVIVATFLVSCGSPNAAKVTQTYTPAQIEQIQQYVPDIIALRDRMREIPTSIQRREWRNVSNFIHGPLGELRFKMNYVTRHLLPKDQEAARKATQDLFDDLVKIEQAAQTGNSQIGLRNYQEALANINNFLQLLPQPNIQSEQSE